MERLELQELLTLGGSSRVQAKLFLYLSHIDFALMYRKQTQRVRLKQNLITVIEKYLRLKLSCNLF